MAPFLAQTAANTVVSAAVSVSIGLGFGLIHRAGGFFHLAHGAVFAVAAFAAWTYHRSLGISQWVAFPLAIATATLVGIMIWLVAYRPIRRGGGGPLALLIGGIGVDLALRNLVALAYGDATLRVRSPGWGETVTLGGAYLSVAQLAMMAFATIAFGGTSLTLRNSRLGRELRAVGDSPNLAEATGVNAEHVLLHAFTIGSAMAGVAGLLAALDTDLRPTMGVQALLNGIAASIVGGARGPAGLAAAALAFALFQNAGALVLPVRWTEPLALVALVFALCLRPHGLWAEQRRFE